jgi:hypothetical protein
MKSVAESPFSPKRFSYNFSTEVIFEDFLFIDVINRVVQGYNEVDFSL